MAICINNKLHDLEIDVYDVLALISVVKDSCDTNDYLVQASVLEAAIKKQEKIIEDISFLY